jgi:superfamily II DNA or RNA helicase
MERHEAAGAYQIGFTATPVGLGKIYHDLVNLIYNSELRKRGVIVPCDVFSPSEIDMTGVSDDGEDYVQSAMRDRFNQVKHAVIGDILDHYHRLNPLQSPTVLFAPGVPESRWIAEYFTNAGVPSVHLEAKTSDEVRNQAFSDLESGVIKMVASYGIITEGWDLPAVSHAIFCRPTKSVVVYLQAIGRVLRAAPGKTHATLQDHAGAWWQPGLGSPNEDRGWCLDDTIRSIRTKARKRRESALDEETEPFLCPKCNRAWRILPNKCICGNIFKRSSRRIFQSDGTLVKRVGSVIKKKRLKKDTDFFRSGIFAAANSGMTVGQAYGIANKNKRAYFNDESARVDLAECNLYTPVKNDPDWHKKAVEVYPWAKR